ncbi:GT-D fold domain-containing glycosyltransferase [Lactococcus cremoris]|uniref:Putative glycosyltransferase n=1 Tax=Lactococcus lactis subsp. cremoris (strain MG1363) TaxID=416870 RepID=A2RLV7_LACLM|nr:GT-D fold domain-containing glycosyltransferase [Lactococcus cremoris]CAL98280.1 putative glycosyltransferase [Lactococcus cremoris subsp. cremoris MG1363]
MKGPLLVLELEIHYFKTLSLFLELSILNSQNTYQKYNDILESIKTFGMEKLILLMLGPTAKVLGFQLSREGYQAIDIGHIDSEYEWYQMGASYKVKLQHKHTAEHNYDTDIIFLQDNDYENSIIGRIE